MLKNHFGNIRNKKEEVIAKESVIKKAIYGLMANHKELHCVEPSKVAFLTFNPTMANIYLKVSFYYLRHYTSKLLL